MATTLDDDIVAQLVKDNRLAAGSLASIQEEAQKAKKTVGQLVLEHRLVSPTDWLKAKGAVLGFSFVSLEKIEVTPNLFKELPEESIRKYQLIPYKREGNVLYVGLVDPENEEALEALRFIATRKGLELEVHLISPEDFSTLISRYEDLEGKVEAALTELDEETQKGMLAKKEGVVFSETVVAEAPISRIVASILRYATESRASDIHIEALDNAVKVRFRVDGDLRDGLFLKKEVHQAIISRVKILCRMRIDESRVPQDGRFHVMIDGRKIDFRVSTLPTYNGEKVVMRILDPTVGIGDLDGLGLEGRNLDVVKRALDLPYGMILASGPTGSGKTTTLYALLKILNTSDVNIISLEDPVEYFIEGVNQSQIRPEIDYTFASGLRHVLRQDPDIILVGEIRDGETANLAVHAALTGHLLLSSIHTNDVVGIIPRLVDMGIERFLVPSTLSVGIAQRLARRLCLDCRESYTPEPAMLQHLKIELAKIAPDEVARRNIKEPLKLYRSRGCTVCNNKGAKGRVAVYEIMEMTPQLEQIIIKDLTETNLWQEAKRQKLITMYHDGIMKALEGVVSMEELLRVVKEE